MTVTASAMGKGLHWAKRPLPEPPRTRKISRWSTSDRDELLEEWLSDETVRNTYDGD
ncbi:MAG TPA: hypothetical protein VFM93_00340 [Candidatus Limnocylindria bacterium]|nr:hypothetical protein [Candidatus Limnocylindria bacterium]